MSQFLSILNGRAAVQSPKTEQCFPIEFFPQGKELHAKSLETETGKRVNSNETYPVLIVYVKWEGRRSSKRFFAFCKEQGISYFPVEEYLENGMRCAAFECTGSAFALEALTMQSRDGAKAGYDAFVLRWHHRLSGIAIPRTGSGQGAEKKIDYPLAHKLKEEDMTRVSRHVNAYDADGNYFRIPLGDAIAKGYTIKG